jgi:hypothetical protein
MSEVLLIGEQRRGGAPAVHFDRTELCRILALYSQRVADGEWRDYAIDQRPGRAVFAVFRHALDRPLFTITKTGQPDGGWEVASGFRKLCRAASLDEALSLFNRTLRLV